MLGDQGWKKRSFSVICHEAVEKLGGSFSQNKDEILFWSINIKPCSDEKFVLKKEYKDKEAFVAKLSGGSSEIS